MGKIIHKTNTKKLKKYSGKKTIVNHSTNMLMLVNRSLKICQVVEFIRMQAN